MQEGGGAYFLRLPAVSQWVPLFSPRNPVTRGFDLRSIARLNNPTMRIFREKNPSPFSPFFARLVCKLEGGEKSTWLFKRFVALNEIFEILYTYTRFSNHEREKVFSKVFRAKARGEGRRESKRSTETTRC